MAMTKTFSVELTDAIEQQKYIPLPADFDSSKASELKVTWGGITDELTKGQDYELVDDLDLGTQVISWEAITMSQLDGLTGDTLDISYPSTESSDEPVEDPKDDPKPTDPSDEKKDDPEDPDPNKDDDGKDDEKVADEVKETAEDREAAYQEIKEAIAIDQIAHVERRYIPRWSFAKMSGDHRTEGETMFARYIVDPEKYFKDDVIVDDYAKTKEENLKIQKYPTGK